MSFKRLFLGKSGEEMAARYLRRQGYRLLEKNFRTKNGEIDIIAQDKDTIVFAEVKTRKSDFLDSPLDAVTRSKQRQISMVAQEYLSKTDLFDVCARFDVIGIQLSENTPARIEHIENAFELSYGN